MWKKAISNYVKSFMISFRQSPISTMAAFVLCFGTNIMITLVVWFQAKVVEQLDKGDGTRFLIFLVSFALASVIYKFRGYIVLPVEQIIDNNAAQYCTKKLMQAVGYIPLRELSKEEVNTRVYRAKEQIEWLQVDVMIFADTLACIVSMVIFIVNMCVYPRGWLYVLLGIICTLMRKLLSIYITKIETALNIRQGKVRRKLDYYFKLLTGKDEILESRFYEQNQFIIRK